MKDEKDPGTIDMIEKKIGRPCLDVHHGPMSGAERSRKLREGVVAVNISKKAKESLGRLASFTGEKQTNILNEMIEKRARKMGL